MSHTVVYVIWADAHCGTEGWQTLTDYEDDGEALVHTVGFLIPAQEPGGKQGHVTVWQSISDSDGIGPFHIPVAMVRSVTALAAGVDVDGLLNTTTDVVVH